MCKSASHLDNHFSKEMRIRVAHNVTNDAVEPSGAINEAQAETGASLLL